MCPVNGSTLHLVYIPGWGMHPSCWDLVDTQLHHHLEAMCSLDDSRISPIQSMRKSFVSWQGIQHHSEFVQRVKNIIHNHPHDRLILIGWSLGGMVALHATPSLSQHVHCIMLIGSTSRFTADPQTNYDSGWTLSILNRMQRQLERAPEKTLRTFFESMFSEKEQPLITTNSFIQQQKEFVLNMFESNLRSLLEGLTYLSHTDLRQTLTTLSCPIEIIHGEHDPICPKEAALHIKEQLTRPATKMHLLPLTGHAPLWTHVNHCAKQITQCISNVMKDKGASAHD